jgi:hypothetical protein
MSCYLLVQIFKAEQESTMTKPLNKIAKIEKKSYWNSLSNRKMSRKCKSIFTGISQKVSIKYSHLFLDLATLLNVLTTVSVEPPYCCSGLFDLHHWWHQHAIHLTTCTKEKQHAVIQLLWADG